ncbi:hypothetical protein L873DRAFT_1386152 [Choiromyces venosus 120613-1]|uniref:Uncharacterized protein n=1 Tax=Choiromyces venosus 120613-1 TaxID=1336337 RepID=A0A3N4JC37_9PEZI|nr:hypothetical protein L873DRAFT_1386152 [Choiromyces venosus 120613-1]
MKYRGSDRMAEIRRTKSKASCFFFLSFDSSFLFFPPPPVQANLVPRECPNFLQGARSRMIRGIRGSYEELLKEIVPTPNKFKKNESAIFVTTQFGLEHLQIAIFS